jgi:translocation and assembly module TamB
MDTPRSDLPSTPSQSSGGSPGDRVRAGGPDRPGSPPPGGAASGPAKPDPRRPLGRWRAFAVAVLALLLLVAALVAAIGTLVWTDTGLGVLMVLARRFAPITIEASGASGALTREFGFERLRIVAGNTEVDIDGLRARLRDFGARPPRFDFASLSARRVEVKVTPSGPSTGPPESIASPVAMSAERLAVGELELTIGPTHLSARALDAELALGPDGYRVGAGHFEYAAQPVTLEGRLGGGKPFALALHGSIRTALRDQSVQAQWRADGSLVDFSLAAEVSGGGAQGSASARIASFDQPALKALQADIDGIDLRAWGTGLPITRISLRADLRPDAASTELAGSAKVLNRDPGPIDANRIPLREASAEVVLTRDALRADALYAALTRGSARGRFAARFGDAPEWQAELKLDGIDPAAIHTKARPLLIDGSATLRQSAGTTAVKAVLRNRGAKVVNASLDLRVDAQRIDIARAELALGRGRLAARGSVGLGGERHVRLDGTIERFEPGVLVRDVDALVSGEFGVDARLAPKPSGQLHFELKDSRAFGRPLTGHGSVRFDAAQQLDVDLALAVRSAHLSARGGLGAAGQSLAVGLEAPAIDELLPGLRGSLKAEATLSGDWTAPAIDARLEAKDLRAGDHALEQASASASYSGGADGRIALRAEVANHSFRDNPALSLRGASATVDGTLAAHAITLRGTSVDARDLALAAQGGWHERQWQGTLREASVGPPLALRLLEPGALTVGAGGVEFGPAQFTALGARFDGVRLSSSDDGLRSSGSFDGLRLQDLIARSGAADRFSGSRRPVAEPLTLRGQWQIALGTQADGKLLIERSAGDLYAATTADSALLLRELRLEATLSANQLAAHAVATSERGGALDASLSALVEHDSASGWRLAQRRPWRLDARAEVPSLARANAVLGEPLGANVRVDGHLSAQLGIGGTPAQMDAKGTLAGDALRLAWIEQGMRLENGRLRARLEGDQLWLDELRFAGPPHVRPKDPRAANKVDFKQEGSVTASGQLRLRDAEGTIRVTAQHLPLLQRPDRWVIASGNASIQASLERAQLDGEFVADAGYVESAPSGLPSLSSDVIVSRAGAEAAQRAPRFALGFNIGIDLGRAFYVKGAGLDARAEGVLRLRSSGRGAVTASGSIEAMDGRYEGFGQRLAIRRARVNFQGPPENPSLDVLAIREGLPVEVGVTVTRSVNNPLVRLYSDPPMADPEAMSWLLFGHAGEQTRADNLALLQAAAGALSGNEKGITGRFAQSLGIDDISLRSGDVRSASSLLPQSSVAGDLRGDRTSSPTATTEVLSIGKRISDVLTISYEQALAGTESVVQLTYRLSQRLYLVARAGTENAFDLVYSWTFD